MKDATINATGSYNWAVLGGGRCDLLYTHRAAAEIPRGAGDQTSKGAESAPKVTRTRSGREVVEQARHPSTHSHRTSPTARAQRRNSGGQYSPGAPESITIPKALSK